MGRLERGRENILEGVRKGYEHAHLLLRRTAPQHPTAGMDGREAALEVRFEHLTRASSAARKRVLVQRAFCALLLLSGLRFAYRIRYVGLGLI